MFFQVKIVENPGSFDSYNNNTKYTNAHTNTHLYQYTALAMTYASYEVEPSHSYLEGGELLVCRAVVYTLSSAQCTEPHSHTH